MLLCLFAVEQLLEDFFEFWRSFGSKPVLRILDEASSGPGSTQIALANGAQQVQQGTSNLNASLCSEVGDKPGAPAWRFRAVRKPSKYLYHKIVPFRAKKKRPRGK